ncbi:MAG TPA: acyl-ACP--UDP-N-acetylglucosamine O-acyltransferase [Candidatus Mailhella excrementigallinarum]|nr:MAG: acyl-[acyl-carrier-protein]--UDP-N-acetylglucosamine O-acyltransferase [Desulfovibrionaceae bacterium]PWL58760.1 MAG: acyl-[acyl-carrier-protein]--UDP-N-acetylglucosamine O-acyltransferase [Desulfovibrionaceae bacterium]HIV66995.1 acyl-ACP--UDP-N-acetylglucosamine O-acyltransferase [Candidatus Mailhella excrementigallinarum]
MAAPVIHPSAFVSPRAELGEDVVVGPCALIEEDVVIGARTRVDAFASIKRYTTMGEDNHVHSHAMVGGEPQDLKFHGEVSRLIIGSRNSIREFSTLHRGTESGGGVTSIGDGNLLMAYVHVAHDCTVRNNIVMSNNATLAGHCLVEDGAIIGGLSAVHQFTRVGRHAFVGGMSGISQDLPPWMLAVGNRALVQSPNIVGLRRIKASQELVSAFKQAYRLLWFSGIPRPDALLQLEAEYGHLPEIAEFITFVRSSERGILPAEERKRD